MKEKGDHKTVKDNKDHDHHHKDKNTHIPRITTRPLIMATDTGKARIRVPRMRLTRVARGLSHTGIPRIRSLPVKAMPSTPLLVLGGKCKLACDVVKERVKQLNITRYKIIASVIAAQKGSQSMVVTSRCLWDQKNDNYFSVKLGEFYVVGTVYVVYAE
uniref:Tctex1 domain-containing protein 1 n=1 Tax=Magallana gigas TaxID=29159 RepID=A0A8W8JFQ3_MAGGI